MIHRDNVESVIQCHNAEHAIHRDNDERVIHINNVDCVIHRDNAECVINLLLVNYEWMSNQSKTKRTCTSSCTFY